MRKEIVTLDPDALELMLDEFIVRLIYWKSRFQKSDSDLVILDRHKSGSLTAISILNNPILKILGKESNPFEVDPNLYFAIRIALARIFQDHPDKRKFIKYDGREIAAMMRGLASKALRSTELAFILHLIEKTVILDYELYHSN